MSQNQLADLSSKLDGRLPVRVWFLDNSSKVFLVSRETSIHAVIRLVLEKFAVKDIHQFSVYCALYESRNGASLDGALGMQLRVGDVLAGWKNAGLDSARLVMGIRLQVHSTWGLENHDDVAARLGIKASDLSVSDYLTTAHVVNEGLLQLQFIQAVYNVITGRFPLTTDQALQLGAIHFIMKFGRYNPSTHVPGFLGKRIVEFVPIKLLKTPGSTLSDWEKRFLGFIERGNAHIHEGTDPITKAVTLQYRDESSSSLGRRVVSLTRRYMEFIYSYHPNAGCTFFRCTQRCSRALPEIVYVGIHTEGVYVMDKSKKPLREFFMEDIARWGFKIGQLFFFEAGVHTDLGTSLLEFESAEGEVIADLLTDYAIAALRERVAEEQREIARQERSPRSPASSPIASTRKSIRGTAQEIRAAVIIQALARGFLLRNEWAREDAAILIQTVFRGYVERVRMMKRIEDMVLSGEL